MNKQVRIVTAALPFVNNVPHLGNLAGSHLPADVFARYCRLVGHETYFVGGSDEHGTATELAAHHARRSPKEICDEYHSIHEQIYKWFGISYDIYSRTSNDTHKTFVKDCFQRLHDGGFIREEALRVAHCSSCHRDLADRLIRGTCPRCGSRDATGDQCEACDCTIEAHELLNPYCVFCERNSVTFEKSAHLFFDFTSLVASIDRWLSEHPRISSSVKAEISGWIERGVKPRCITRRLNWGIDVPLPGHEDKVLYVWFENLFGYVSIVKELLGARGDALWRDPSTQVFHFLGKDNVAFHGLFWPAELLACGNYVLPSDIVGLQHLNYEGKKFSKSKGTGLFCDEVVRSGIPADYWRFYLVSCLPEKSDTEFNAESFRISINSLLVGIFGNLLHRSSVLLWNLNSGRLETIRERNAPLEEQIAAFETQTLDSYERCKFRDALDSALAIARLGNAHLAAKEPWKSRDITPVLYALRCARVTARLLAPIVPDLSAQALELAGNEEPEGCEIPEPRILLKKL